MFEQEIFDGKKFSDLLKEIHNNQKKKEKQLNDLINILSQHIKDKGDAAIIAPVLASYLGISVSNNDQLIRLAGVIQKYIQSDKNSENGDILSDKEREEIFNNIKKIQDEQKN